MQVLVGQQQPADSERRDDLGEHHVGERAALSLTQRMVTGRAPFGDEAAKRTGGQVGHAVMR